MPVFRYRPLSGNCRLCGKGFDHVQARGTPDLQDCPTCGKKVERDPVSPVAIPRILRKPSVTEAKQAGFTVLKKTSGGEYEKQ